MTAAELANIPCAAALLGRFAAFGKPEHFPAKIFKFLQSNVLCTQRQANLRNLIQGRMRKV